MDQFARAFYDRLPPPMRSIAASARGYALRRWRYGPETDRLVEEALERERWTNAQWRVWREERLAYLLHRAATRVPYYRDQWARRRRAGDRRSPEHLEHWPVLEKQAVREAPRLFVADDCRPETMFHEHTSGTTGKSLDLWWSRETVRRWFALFEARCRRWHGVSRHDRWAILGGQLVVPQADTRPPFWVWNAALHQLYMSTYHLAPAAVPLYLDAINRYRITYLLGYSSALHELAVGALRAGRTDVRLHVVVTNAEPLYAHQRDAIRTAFQCEVRETYGMAEIVAAASECESGTLHTWPEAGHVEVLRDRQPVPGGTTGDLVATGLLNTDMVLVRYAVGDQVVLAATGSRCGCGRLLAAIASIEGRADDVVVTRDGRRIGRLDPVFKAGLPIEEAQIIQESLDRLRVRYVPAKGFTVRAAERLTHEIRARVGPFDVVLEPVAQIPRTANGKFRAVLSNLPPGGGPA
jgi:phenylacetate-CoA ligase